MWQIFFLFALPIVQSACLTRNGTCEPLSYCYHVEFTGKNGLYEKFGCDFMRKDLRDVVLTTQQDCFIDGNKRTCLCANQEGYNCNAFFSSKKLAENHEWNRRIEATMVLVLTFFMVMFIVRGFYKTSLRFYKAVKGVHFCVRLIMGTVEVLLIYYGVLAYYYIKNVLSACVAGRHNIPVFHHLPSSVDFAPFSFNQAVALILITMAAFRTFLIIDHRNVWIRTEFMAWSIFSKVLSLILIAFSTYVLDFWDHTELEKEHQCTFKKHPKFPNLTLVAYGVAALVSICLEIAYYLYKIRKTNKPKYESEVYQSTVTSTEVTE